MNIFQKSIKLFHVKPWCDSMPIANHRMITVAHELLTFDEMKKYKVPLYYVDYRKYPRKTIYYDNGVRVSSVSGKYICNGIDYGINFITKKGAKLK